MSRPEFQIDYRSARGSNTGDGYHELWAARHALKLLDADNPLSAITVEGLTTQEGAETVWDGVDCGLFFGDVSASTANRVEIQQLKYSASNPTDAWTVARLCSGKDGKPKTSPIRRLASAYKGLIAARPNKPFDSLRICLVSNQPIASDLMAAVEEGRNAVPTGYRRAWKSGMPELHRLVYASGLEPAEFQEFATILDLQGASGSRFAIEDGMLKAISEWTDIELQESANRIRDYIRKRMLPEAAGELITRENVLVQFGGVSDDYTLFPCPSKIKPVASAVPRAIACEIASQMKDGAQYVCLHGVGGVGKTTTLQQIERSLPDGSMMVVFDCYGAGSYLDASALRHRPQDAFVQLTNEIARRLRLPLLLVPNALRDYPRAFKKRLELAAAAMAATVPEGLLVIAIDAADNSVLAAQTRTPAEACFIHDFVTLNSLPNNVRILMSARTGRLEELRLPTSFRMFPLPTFDHAETASNVARYWQAPLPWVDDFHHLSGGIPRVQAYAFENAASTPEHALEALRPFGKNLDQVFREQFLFALSKNARGSDLENICAGLISLPRPTPLPDLAAVLGLPEATINDVCIDLAPGVRNIGGLLSFADEDFEHFVRESAGGAIVNVQAHAAEHFLRRARSDAYAALNIAPALFSAGRGKALLELVEREPEPPSEVMPDPIRRREVQVQRLQIAIRVCREAKDPAHALRFLLIGAEAIKTERATLKLLIENPGLTARYAKDTASRLILGDPDRISAHGPLLLHLLAEDAGRGDAISVREGRRRLSAWESARWDDYEDQQQRHGHASAWKISPSDIAAAMYARLLLEGPASAMARYRRIKPRALAHLAGKSLVERLLAEGKTELVEQLASMLPYCHALFILVPLAAAGRAVDLQRLASGLRQLKRRTRLNAELLTRSDSGDRIGSWVIDTALAATEVLVAKNGDKHVVSEVLDAFLDPELRRIDKVSESKYVLLDAIFRAVTLVDVLAGKQTKSDQILTPRPKPPEDEKKRTGHDNYANDHDRKLGELVGAFAGLYIARARLVVSPARDKGIDSDLLLQARSQLERESWRIDRQYGAFSMRTKAATSLALLLAVGVSPVLVMESALVVRRGWAPSDAKELFYRLAAVPALHDQLIDGIAQTAVSFRSQRSTAEERSDSLSAYARLIAPISPNDADAIFKWAIDVASELDSEIMDQLRLIGQMVRQSHLQAGTRGRAVAMELSEVVHDAAIRLDTHDHFPWTEAINALSLLDYPVALAAVARWDSAEVSGLGRTLDSLLTTGLDAGKLSVSQAAAIAGLLQGVDGKALLQICELAERDGREAADRAAEEFARDYLLERLDNAESLLPFFSRHSSGYWTKRLQAQGDFKKANPATATSSDHALSDKKGESSAKPNTWTEVALTDAELLGKEARRLLEQSKKSNRFIFTGAVLSEAGEQVPVRLRVAHLDALMQLDTSWDDDDVLHALLARLKDWASTPAVGQWRSQHLPELLSFRLPALCRYLPHHDKELKSSLAMIQSTHASVQDVLLRGVERNIDYFSAASTFALTGIISEHLKANQVAELCDWYITRLSSRIRVADRENVPEATLPLTLDEAVGRFFYAFLGDVDVRIRWRCAHSLRRLARIGDQSTLDAVVAQYSCQEEPAFRERGVPFYWVAARLWLIIAIDRIALESPDAAAKHGAWLLQVALDEAFPHLLVREFARDGCLKLIEARCLSINDGAIEALAKVNQSPLPRASKKRDYGNTFDGFDHYNESLRFRFNGMDTLRYWYNPVLRAFSDVTPKEFLRAAEQWIVDEWGFREEESSRIRERKKRRSSNYNWRLYSKSHGSHPTMEDFETYLEWNAMWCAAGQLLRTRQLKVSRYSSEELADRIRYSKLTAPPSWLADLVNAPPLQKSRWRAPSAPVSEWIESVSNEDFIEEALPSDTPNYVIVHAYIDDRSSGHHQTTRISTGLVSPDTAHALVRALQTTASSHDFYICPEGHDCEIDEAGFKLTGWLASYDGDSLLDEKDVFRNGIRRIEFGPGKSAVKLLALEQRIEPSIGWYRAGQEAPCVIYETWGYQESETEEERRNGSTTESSGYRLLIRKEDLAEFLTKKKQDLILEVGITRREPRKRGYSNDAEEPKETEFERLLLFRRDGAIQGAERDFGAWRSSGSRTPA